MILAVDSVVKQNISVSRLTTSSVSSTFHRTVELNFSLERTVRNFCTHWLSSQLSAAKDFPSLAVPHVRALRPPELQHEMWP
jgi:hypothetical protein